MSPCSPTKTIPNQMKIINLHNGKIMENSMKSLRLVARNSGFSINKYKIQSRFKRTNKLKPCVHIAFKVYTLFILLFLQFVCMLNQKNNLMFIFRFFDYE